VYVVVVVGDTERVPPATGVTAPIELSRTNVVALVVVHVSTDVPPTCIEVGPAISVQTGFGFVGGSTGGTIIGGIIIGGMITGGRIGGGVDGTTGVVGTSSAGVGVDTAGASVGTVQQGGPCIGESCTDPVTTMSPATAIEGVELAVTTVQQGGPCIGESCTDPVTTMSSGSAGEAPVGLWKEGICAGVSNIIGGGIKTKGGGGAITGMVIGGAVTTIGLN